MAVRRPAAPVPLMPAVNRHPHPVRLVPALLAAVMAWSGLSAGPARAQSVAASGMPVAAAAPRDYRVPAGALDAALAQFAEAAGVTLLFEQASVASLRSAGLNGRYTVQQAIELLLQGTGLEAVGRGTGVYALRPVPGALLLALPTIEVIGQAENDPKDEVYRTAGSRNVLTRDDIERFRGTSVGDIFQGMPGVLVGENRNSGGLDVNIRGMQGQGRVPVLVDGTRQETTVYRGYAGVASRSYIDPDLIGGLSVEKGPTMNAQGTGATGGLVIMRTIDAEDIVREGKDFGIRLRGTAIGNNSGSVPGPGTPAGYNTGSASGQTSGVFRTDCVIASLCEGPFDLANADGPKESMNRPSMLKPRSWAGSLALAKRFEMVDVVAAYARRQQGNYYAGTKGPVPHLDLSDRLNRGFYTEVRPRLEGATRFRAGEQVVNTNFESESYLLKSRFYLPGDHETELSFMRYDSTYGEMMPSQLLWLGQVRQTEGSHVDARTYAIRHRWNPEGNPLYDVKVNLWHTDTKSLNRNYSDEGLNLGFGSGSEKYRRWGLDLSNAMRFDRLGGIRLEYGLSLQRETVNGTAQGNELVGSGGRSGNRREVSAFGNMQWRVLPTVTLDAGLRYTRFRSADDKPRVVDAESAYCVNPGAGGYCDPIMMTSKQSGAAPQLSLLWEPRPGLQFYARHAEALRMPSLFETTSGFSVSPSQDIHLKPEHATSREIGVNLLKDGLWRPSDKFRLKAAYFRNHTNDYLTRTFPNTWEEGSGKQFFSLRNIESVSFHGFELSGSYDAGTFFISGGATRYTFIETCHFGSYRRYTCTDYGIANSYVNNMIPPNWHASATAGVRLLDRRLTMGLRGTFMGKRNQVPAFNDDTQQGLNAVVPWHGYQIWDLFASYRINDRVSVDFNIDNLTDRYYLDALSLGLVPAPGRTARLSVTMQF
ncbi:TonB-dependent receptor [Pigmentiphaga sp.]|uniref:TonB-dependent receptor n=1 Tax=Pigmentiphaga sp. TaxID=1977564 RepID=UPI0025CCE3D1|nr:TonB-dependent receptor [Pigmentiphaga sp.]